MNMKQIEFFINVADSKNIYRASQKLFISKQGLSKSLQTLEAELSIPLFVRSAQGLELSEAGQFFYHYAQRALSDYELMMSDMQSRFGADKKHLRIAMTRDFFSCISMDIVLSYLNENPEVAYSSGAFSDPDVEKQVLTGEYELAFSTAMQKDSRLEYYKLFTNYRCLIVNKAHPLASMRTIRFSDLVGVRIAIPVPNYFDETFIVEQCAREGFAPDLFPCHDAQMLWEFAEENWGVALMVGEFGGEVPPERETILVYFDDLQASSYDVSLAVLKGKRQPAHIKRFIAHAIRYCANLFEKTPSYPF